MSEEKPTLSNLTALAFLGHQIFEDGGAIRGAILVTDEFGKPLEFRCTAKHRQPAIPCRTGYRRTSIAHSPSAYQQHVLQAE